MLPRIDCFVFMACLILGGAVAHADGLVFQLPPDGTWARYVGKVEAEAGLKGSRAEKLSTLPTITIRSVGEVMRNEQKCRWIELQIENKGKGLHPTLLLKMLIPEEYLHRGEDPLSHAVLTFFNPKPNDKRAPLVESYIDQGFNRIQYETERFRPIFPKPFGNAKKLRPETVETPAGRFDDCEVLAGTSNFDGQTHNDGRWVFKAAYRLVLHPKAPFGVVAMHADVRSVEFTKRGPVSVVLKETLTLSEIGKNAVSQLPQEGSRPPLSR